MATSEGHAPRAARAAHAAHAGADAAAAFHQARRDVPWMEASEAYARLRAAGHKPFLLGAQGSHPEADWSFVAFTPTVELRVEGDFVDERRPDGSNVQTRRNALGHLQAAFDDWRWAAPAERDVPFTGGWVGYLGYEFARNVEPTLPKAPGDPLVPDGLLWLCLDAVAFDRRSRRAVLFCAQPDGDAAAAASRADAVAAVLAKPGHPVMLGPAAAPAQWEMSLDERAFVKAVGDLKAHVAVGDLFQANLATRFAAPCDADPLSLLRALEAANPAPFMALLQHDDFAIVSASPEQLLRVRGGRIASRPIAGTRKRGATPAEDEAMESELATDAKEQAEHRMLVDLVRNDVARVAVPGTVEVPELGSVERHRHVMHLASRVEAALRPTANFTDCLAALFPGGTVTGAPKHRACLRIAEAEPVRRGPYTGSAGFLSWSGNAHWSILIRTIVLRDGQALVHAGSGIVAGSDPAREWKEARRKARALLEAATGTHAPPSPAEAARLGEVRRRGGWRLEPAAAPRAAAGARVLLVDNYDSFVHNLADYCALLGAATRTVRNDADCDRALRDFRPTHVILSPGPGWPADAGCTPRLARDLVGKLPLLGVCLGHQAMAQAHGAPIAVHPAGAAHGMSSEVHHGGAGLFAGLPSPIEAARYHSLAVAADEVGPGWTVDARLADGTVMAFRHQRHPAFGLQFHPESVGTPHGLRILAAFLAAGPAAPSTRNPFNQAPDSKPDT